MKLLIAGGGTGGHVFPAIAVARAWKEHVTGGQAVLVGTARGLETRLAPEAGLELETIRVAGLKGMGGMRLARNAAIVPASLVESLRLIGRLRPHVALGVGGYASGPVMLAAVLRGVPSVIFEPNARPGLANRLLAPLVKRIATAHAVTAERWGRKAAVTGCPVRREFFAVPPKEHRAPFTVLITGGSQGARAINEAAMAALEHLALRRDSLFFVHQTGEHDYNRVREAYARWEIQSEVLPFIRSMADKFAQADVIVCRSGAITTAEVAAAGRAAIFIPFAAATDSHQFVNAQVLVRAGAARMIPQHELDAGRLAREILSLLDSPAELGQMEQRVRKFARPRAAESIAEMLLQEARR
jgi:UDP-N-acetylglucosamine--N-acetylmuramyl-(pentapeptide) pyrophosphoryl-undecaprenol N-acetylglucosamine transferase